MNICRLEGCNGTIELVRSLLKTFRPYEKDLRVNKGNFAISTVLVLFELFLLNTTEREILDILELFVLFQQKQKNHPNR